MKAIYLAYHTYLAEEGYSHIFIPNIGKGYNWKGEDVSFNLIETIRKIISKWGTVLEDKGEKIPLPYTEEEVNEKFSNGLSPLDNINTTRLLYIDVDFSIYRRKTDNKLVKRNVCLPSWLQYEVNEAGINVSKVLQDALKTTLSTYNSL